MRSYLLFVYSLAITLFPCVCIAATNEGANKLYVEASIESSQYLNSSKEWGGSYSSLLDSYVNVKSKIELILYNYPSSDIAAGIMSEKIKISGLTLTQFKDKENVIRKLKESEQSPMSCALLIVHTIDDEKEKAITLLEIARMSAAYGKDKKNVMSLLSQALETAKISSPSYKSDKSSAFGHIAQSYTYFGHLEQAFSVTEYIDNVAEKTASIIDIAEKYIEVGQKEKAAKLLSQALAIAKENVEMRGFYLDRISDKYIELGLLDRAFDAARADNDTIYNPKKLLKISDKYSNSGQKEKAAIALSKALEVTNTLDSSYSSTMDNYLYEIALRYACLGFTDKAFAVFAKKKDQSNYSNSSFLIGLAELHSNKGDIKSSSKLLGQAIELIDKLNDESSNTYLLFRIAAVYAKDKKKEKAEHFLYQAIESTKTIDDAWMKSMLLVNQARIFSKIGYGEYASHMLTKSLIVAKTIPSKPNKNQCFASIAEMHAELDQLDQALTILTSGLAFDSWIYRDVFVKIADKYASIGGWDKVFEVIQLVNDSYLKSRILIEFIDKYGDIVLHKDQASHLLSRFIKACNTIEDSKYKIKTLIKIAQLYATAGQKEQAGLLASVAFEAGKAIGNAKLKVEALSYIALMSTEIGGDNDDQVVQLLSQFLEIAQKIREDGVRSIALAAMSLTSDKMGKKLSSEDKLILHEIVSATDPMRQLRVSVQ